MSQTKAPSLLDALTPIVALLIMLATSVYLFSSDSSSGANQIALIMAACIALLVAVKNGYKWQQIEAGIVKSVASVTGALLILFAVGGLIGTWILAGHSTSHDLLRYPTIKSRLFLCCQLFDLCCNSN